MRWGTGTFLAMFVALIAALWVVGAGCYPHVCAPNDTSCLPCADIHNTNETCPSWPSDDKKPDAGVEASR
jgi:hypothetical protein